MTTKETTKKRYFCECGFEAKSGSGLRLHKNNCKGAVKPILEEEVVKETKEARVSVPQSFLENLKADMARLEQSNKMLINVADKKQLAKFYQQNKEKIPTLVKLRKINGKVIVGWENMIKNKVEKDQHGRWYEDQVIKLIYEDGTSEEMPYPVFGRGYAHIHCKRTGVSTDEDGKVMLKLENLDNADKYEVGVEFVN